MKTCYKDFFGTYSITEHADGTATLICCDAYGNIAKRSNHKSTKSAKQSLARYCDGMPRRA